MSEFIPWHAPWTHRAVIVLLMGIGLYLAWRMGWRGRRLGYPACPRCLYDLRETAAGKPCPECGYSKDKRLKRWPLKRSIVRSLPGLILALTLPTLIVIHHTREHGAGYWLRWGPGYWLFGWEHTGGEQLGPFTLDWYADRRYTHATRLQIQPGGIELTGYGLYMWEPVNHGQDITGNGKPDLLLYQHTGGNSSAYKLYELDDGRVYEILSFAGQPSHVEDADGDGVWEYYTTTYSGSGHRPEDYKMQRLDKLVQDPTHYERWLLEPLESEERGAVTE